MKDKDFIKKMLEQYEVPQAKERDISNAIQMGQHELYKLVCNKTPFKYLITDQLKYISPLLWATQLLAIILIAVLFVNLESPYLEVKKIIFEITPLLSIFAVPELIKSAIYGMSELENVCKNSASKALTARLLVIGCINLVAITIITAFVSVRYALPFSQIILYSLVPFNIINSINLIVFELFKVRSSFIAITVSLCMVIIMKIITDLSFFTTISEMTWGVLFWITTALLIADLCRFMRSMENKEEYIQWN
ncbi:hypothetical protein [uncultured Oscillibacter sp.]|uniref:hypothetical protein n=1 Tax=uncultured Oscillibacter sp. TaxID=876091 RepID=UPI0025D63938|nr:hypothetical protein [uncultured Oscillibacter sp.]